MKFLQCCQKILYFFGNFKSHNVSGKITGNNVLLKKIALIIVYCITTRFARKNKNIFYFLHSSVQKKQDVVGTPGADFFSGVF